MQSVIQAIYQSYKIYYRQNKRISNQIFAELEKVGNLETSEKNKIQFYIGQGLLVRLWFNTLKETGYQVNPKDIAYLSAWTPFYDDMMDEQGKSHQQIMEQLESNNSAGSSSHFKYLYDQSFKRIENQKQVLNFLKKVGLSQNESLKQRDTNLSDDELVEITRAKGGWATCFYASANGFLNDDEINLFYEIGACLQLCNDLFDIYKDDQQGITTLPISNISLTSKLYDEWMQRAKQLLQDLTTSENYKQLFWKQIILILSRGEIALNLLLKLKDSNNNTLILNNLSRKQLICDMEKPSNIWSSFMRTWQNKLVTSS